jgi:hypothetical protein
MYSHHITKSAYELVPVLDMNVEWTDAKLAKRYGLTEQELEFMASKIRPYENGEFANKSEGKMARQVRALNGSHSKITGVHQ